MKESDQSIQVALIDEESKELKMTEEEVTEERNYDSNQLVSPETLLRS